MSQDNLEIVRRNNDAYNRRDLGAYLDTVADTVTFRSRFSVMDHRVYRGRDDISRYFAELDEVWSRYEMQLERLVAVGPRVAGLFHLARGRSGERSPVGGAPRRGLHARWRKSRPDRRLRDPGGGPRSRRAAGPLAATRFVVSRRTPGTSLPSRARQSFARSSPPLTRGPKPRGRRQLCQTTAGAATTPWSDSRRRESAGTDPPTSTTRRASRRGSCARSPSCRQPSTSSPPERPGSLGSTGTTSR